MIVQLVFNGLIDGSILALAALGLTLIFASSNFANVAHGDMMTLAAYLAFLANLTFGWNIYFSALFAIVVSIILGLFMYHLAIRPLEKNSSKATLIVASIGLALIIRYSIYLIWGGGVKSYDLPLTKFMRLGSLSFSKNDLAILIVTVITMVLLYLLLNHTRIGIEVRAVIDVPDLARVSGIFSGRILNVIWIIALSLAAIAGFLLAMKSSFHPNLGFDILIPAFAAVILGGIGSPLGAIIGGYLLGIAQSISTLYFDSSYKLVVAFLILVLILIINPKGIMGGRLSD